VGKIFRLAEKGTAMPLIRSSSKAAREANIREMITSGHKPDQAVAAGYAMQRRAQGSATHQLKKMAKKK
jgi:hypothetical protein